MPCVPAGPRGAPGPKRLWSVSGSAGAHCAYVLGHWVSGGIMRFATCPHRRRHQHGLQCPGLPATWQLSRTLLLHSLSPARPQHSIHTRCNTCNNNTIHNPSPQAMHHIIRPPTTRSLATSHRPHALPPTGMFKRDQTHKETEAIAMADASPHYLNVFVLHSARMWTRGRDTQVLRSKTIFRTEVHPAPCPCASRRQSKVGIAAAGPQGMQPLPEELRTCG